MEKFNLKLATDKDLNHTEIIAFFSSEGFFRLKSEAKQKELFDNLKKDFFLEFPDFEENAYCPDLFDFLRQYQSEQAAARKEREKKRLLARSSLPVAAGCNKATDHIKQLPAGKYVLTSAQNNTHVNETMLKCLLQFCEHKDAKLLIGRMTYNKAGFAQPDIDSEGLWYDTKIKPFLVHGHIDLQGAHFLADANIIPTAKNPLSGFSAATMPGVHVILPHTKIALQVDAALMGDRTKIVTSTGAITLCNYIMRKAGSVAALEHCIGAVFVDTTDPDKVIIRHLELMPESDMLYDLDYCYTTTGYFYCENHVAILQPGDIHAEEMERVNLDNLLELIRQYRPKSLTLHDIINFTSRNHHNIKSCAFMHLQTVRNRTVEDDIIDVTDIIKVLHKVLPKESDIYIIESNHDGALMTWLLNEDFKKDPVNAITYLTCMLGLYQYQAEFQNTDDFNMLQYAYQKIGEGELFDNLHFNKVGKSLVLAGIEVSCHGHDGINGAKGSPSSFRKLGIPMNTGHTHSPGICGRVYTAGVTASKNLGYNEKGASSWEIAHIITYTNGQRQILFC